jgi:hypothetical protein
MRGDGGIRRKKKKEASEDVFNFLNHPTANVIKRAFIRKDAEKVIPIEYIILHIAYIQPEINVCGRDLMSLHKGGGGSHAI